MTNKFDIEHLGYRLQVALRKVCDSKATTIVYNVVHSFEDDIWHDYLNHLKKYDYDNGIEIWENLRNASEKYCNEMSRDLIVKYRTTIQMSLVHILNCAFALFSDDDWHRYAYVVGEYYDEV